MPKYNNFFIKHQGEIIHVEGDGWLKEEIIPIPTTFTKGALTESINKPQNSPTVMKSFPFNTVGAQIHMVTIPKGVKSDPHFHPDYQIRICVKGSLEIHFPGEEEKKETISPGEYIVIPGLTPYFTIPLEDYSGVHVTKCKQD